MSYATTLDEVLALRSENFHLRDRLSLARKECEIMRDMLLNPDPDSEPDVARLHREKCDEITKRIEAETELAALRASAVAEPVAWQDIAAQLCAVDGNGFYPGDCSPSQLEAYEIRAKSVAGLYAHPAPAAPVPASVREVLQHALARFECLEDHFEETGDEALRAMSSVDADRMQAALASLPAPAVEPEQDVDAISGCADDQGVFAQFHANDFPEPAAAPTREEIASPQMQAIVQRAIMDHPHYSGGPCAAYGYAGAAIKAVSLALKAAPAK